MNENSLSINEITKDFFSLKTNKSAGFEEFLKSFERYFDELIDPIFERSLFQGIFPGKMVVAKISPIFKANKIKLVENYGPMFSLPHF